MTEFGGDVRLGFRWEESSDGQLHSVYHFQVRPNHRDGISWERDGTVAIDFFVQGRNKRAPLKRVENGDTTMWYPRPICRKALSNWILPSPNGLSDVGTMDANVGIDVSQSGFDSDDIANPSVFQTQAACTCFTTATDFGARWLGLAVCGPPA